MDPMGDIEEMGRSRRHLGWKEAERMDAGNEGFDHGFLDIENAIEMLLDEIGRPNGNRKQRIDGMLLMNAETKRHERKKQKMTMAMLVTL